MKCLDCGSETTEYVYEASAEICTICGTLVQSSVDTLVDLTESQTYDEGRAVVNESVFTGQGTKGHSGRVQASKCHITLERLCSSLQYPSLASRARNIFDNVMRAGQIRYGPISKLVIGASAAIALRESGGRASLAEIAVRLGVKMAPLTRMFAKAKAILDISLPFSDPALYFSTLLRKVSDLSSRADTPLSPKLKSFLDSAQFAAVSKLAVSLAALTKDVSLYQNRAIPAVACAYIIMAFEGELGAAMPDYVELIRHLALYVGFRKGSIQERYRELSRLVTDWRNHLPWADQVTKHKQGAAARDATARYLKDVVAFQMQLKIKLLDDGDSSVSEDGASPEDSDDGSWDGNGDLDDFERPASQPAGSHSSSPSPKKKRRLSPSCEPRHSSPTTPKNPNDDAYLSNAGRPDTYVHRTKRPGISRKEAMHRAVSSLLSLTSVADGSLDTDFVPAMSISAGDLRRAVLHQPSFATTIGQNATNRLSVLCISRGGEEHIDDEELFGQGELESLWRDEDERAALEATWALQDRMCYDTPDKQG